MQYSDKKGYYRILTFRTLMVIGLFLFVWPLFSQEEDKGKWFSYSELGVGMMGWDMSGMALKESLFYRNRVGVLGVSDWGVQEYLTPAYQRASGFMKVRPVPFFEFSSYAGYDYMFSAVTGGMKKFPSSHAEYDSDTRDDIDGESIGGIRLSALPKIKLKYNRLMFECTLKIDYHDYGHRSYYYDYETGLLHKGRDTGFNENGVIVYQLGPCGVLKSLVAGINLYGYQVASTGNRSMKLSAVIEGKSHLPILPDNVDITIGISSGVFLDDRYHEGESLSSFKLAATIPLN